MDENQFRTLKKYLEVLGEEVPGVIIDDLIKGQKKGYRLIRELLDDPRKSLSHIVENNLDRIKDERKG